MTRSRLVIYLLSAMVLMVVSGSDLLDPGRWPLVVTDLSSRPEGTEVTRALLGFQRPVAWLARAALLALVAAVLSAGAHEVVEAVRTAFRRSPARSAVVGLVATLAATVVVLALAYVVIGIPLALIITMAAVLAVLLGLASIGTGIGDILRERFGRPWSPVLSAALGTFLFAAVLFAAAAVPVLGPVVQVAFVLMAVGAVVLAELERRKRA